MSDRLQAATGGNSGLGPKLGFARWIAGRARRREYWLWVVCWLVVILVLAGVAPGSEAIAGVPVTLAMIRRLHDLGRTGWIAIGINVATSFVGQVEAYMVGAPGEDGLWSSFFALAVLIALGCLPGQAQRNAYGPPPGHKEDLAETFS